VRGARSRSLLNFMVYFNDPDVLARPFRAVLRFSTRFWSDVAGPGLPTCFAGTIGRDHRREHRPTRLHHFPLADCHWLTTAHRSRFDLWHKLPA